MLNTVLNTLFPIRCIGNCERFDTWLCNECVIPALTPNKVKDYIGPNIDVWHLAEYNNPLIQKAIHELKYNHIASVAMNLGALLREHLVRAYLPVDDFDYIIPVPLHAKRLRERGFNQAELLARSIAVWPVMNAIQRSVYTPPQATLNRAQRLMNLESTFSVQAEYQQQVIGKRCLLIDDVCTTGSTLKACADQLSRAGVSALSAIVIAID